MQAFDYNETRETNSMGLYGSSTLPVFMNDDRFMKIPYISILSDRIVLYQLSESPICKKCSNDASKLNLQRNKPSGKLSRQQGAKIRKILDTWLSSIKEYNQKCVERFEKRPHYPIFITLTLSSKQVHNDNYIKKNMLSQFIDKLKENHGIDHVFWRAESQENGNIHFHIITDKFIHKDAITKYWDWIQAKEGYRDARLVKSGKDKSPSTNVKGMESVEDFIDYVLKYATKEEKYRKIEGRIYGMTDSLRKLRPFITTPDSNTYEEIGKMISSTGNKIITEEYATIILLNKRKVSSFKTFSFVVEYSHYLLKTYNDLYYGFQPDEVSEEVKNIQENDQQPEKMYYQYSFFDECPDYCRVKDTKFYDSQYW